MNVRRDSRTLIRKVDGDLHILPPEQVAFFLGHQDDLRVAIRRAEVAGLT